MSRAAEKALRRVRKIATYLQHVRPGNNADMEDIERWAGAANAAGILERYLECVKEHTACSTT